MDFFTPIEAIKILFAPNFLFFLGGDRALVEHSEHLEHSDAATPNPPTSNSLTPNL